MTHLLPKNVIWNTWNGANIDILMDVNSRAIQWSCLLVRFYSNDEEFMDAIENNQKDFIMKVWISSSNPEVKKCIESLEPKVQWIYFDGDRTEPITQEAKKSCTCLVS